MPKILDALSFANSETIKELSARLEKCKVIMSDGLSDEVMLDLYLHIAKTLDWLESVE